MRNSMTAIAIVLALFGTFGVAPASDPDELRAEVRAKFEEKLEAVNSKYHSRIRSDGFFRKFRKHLQELPGPEERKPKTLFELSKVVGRYPEIADLFLDDVQRHVGRQAARNSKKEARLASQLARKLAKIDDRFAPLPPASAHPAYLENFLDTLTPGQGIVSSQGTPPGQVLLEDGPPLRVSKLTFDQIKVEVLHESPPSFDFFCKQDPACEWPIFYDFLPKQIYLHWKSTVYSAAEIQDIFAEQGAYMTLFLNGGPLWLGPQVRYNDTPPFWQDFWAVAFPCEQATTCIITSIFAQALPSVDTLPWNFELRVYKEEPLSSPEIIGVDELGNPIVVSSVHEIDAKASVTISGNPTNATTYFEEKINPTFQSDRCTDCHGFGTIDALAQHHGYPNGFTEDVNARLKPSAYDPKGHVITCAHCHWVPKQWRGKSFKEVEWKAPHKDLGTNWKNMNASQVCNKVKSSLPTHELRHEHFHEDARLFWAIEDPMVMGKKLLPRAEPQDFAEFLERIDRWNDGGAPCP